MRTSIFTVSALATMLCVATSCDKNNNNDEPTPARDEVKINAVIDGMQTRAAINPDGSGKLENGDLISLHFKNMGMPYTMNKTALFWDEITKDANENVPFRAWYPVYEFSGPAQEHAYNVAGANNNDASRDLLMTPTVTVKPKQEVNLQFRHVMHKLNVKLTSNIYKATELAAAKVELKKLRSHANVNFETGKINTTDVPDQAEYNVAYPAGTGANTSFIVAPQKLTGGREFIEITVGSKKFEYKVPAALTQLESGKVLTLNLTINRDAVTLTGMNILPWGDQSDVNGNATERP